MNPSMFFLNGVVAKITTGVAITAVAVGGMQAVEKYELTDKLQQVSVVEQDIDLDAPLEEQFPGDEAVVALADVDYTEVEEEATELESEVEVAPVVEEAKNHGQAVSEFVHENELTGCEKGQAVAAHASKNKSEDDEKNPCDKDGEPEEEETEGEEVDDEQPEDDSADEGDDDDDGEANGNGNGNGKGNGKKDK